MLRKLLVIIFSALLIWWVVIPLLSSVFSALGFILGMAINLAATIFVIWLVIVIFRRIFRDKPPTSG